MENNIFFINKKDKHNPDVIQHLTRKNSEVKKNVFEPSTNIYNPITGVVPDKIKNQKDLKLEKDTSILNIKKLISDREKIRKQEEAEYKPVKTKVLPNVNMSTGDSIKTYEDMKKDQDLFSKNYSKEIDQQKAKYNEILNGLQKLGIVKK